MIIILGLFFKAEKEWLELGRNFILVDNNPQAAETMKVRFKDSPSIEWVE